MAREMERNGYEVIASDISSGQDVFHVPLQSKNVVTNPPYGHDGSKKNRRAAEEIALRILSQSPEKLALLLPFQWWCSVGRKDRLFQRFPVARVWAFADRFAMWPHGKPLNKSKPPANSAWFVWDASVSGATQLGHITFGGETDD
jgi:hypothetical protein